MDRQLSQQLSELKTQLASITEAIARIDQKVHEPEPEYKPPAWVKLAVDDTVPLSQVLQAAQVWDEDDFDTWTETWNNSKNKRIQLLTEALAVWEAEVSSRKFPPSVSQISSLEHAQKLVDSINAFKKLQTTIVDYIHNYDRTPLVCISDQNHNSNFRAYYNWINSFVDGLLQFRPVDSKHAEDTINSFYTQIDPCLALFNQSLEVLNHLLAQIDLDIIDTLKAVDPHTFEIAEAKPEIQASHKKRQLMIYKKSLKSAFEYLNTHSV